LELLRSFVKKDWVNLIKSEDLMLMDKSYILEDFSEEESDIVYKVNICGQDVIFYILYSVGVSIQSGLQNANETAVLYI
jgi:hypothetical protein